MVSSIPAGSRLLAEDLLPWSDQINENTSPGWTSHNPTWTASGGGAAIGNGTKAGRYRRADNSDLIIFEFRMTWGSTTTNGTGFYTLSLPVAASANSLLMTCGPGAMLDTSAAARRPGSLRLETATTITIESVSGTVGAAVPWTWATGDTLQGQITYEAA